MVVTAGSLSVAASGDVEAIRRLLERKPHLLNERAAHDQHHTLLTCAASCGQHAAVAFLLASGCEVNTTNLYGWSALAWATFSNATECVRLLCEAGADVDAANGPGFTPLMVAAGHGYTDCMKLLCSFGACRQRTADIQGEPCAETFATRGHRREAAQWLARTRDWTALHHIEQLTPSRTVALLRAGADLHVGTPSPIERAREVGGDVAELIKLAAEAWAPATHFLFPAAARDCAVSTMWLGYQLAWSGRLGEGSGALRDIWRVDVIPLVVERSSTSVSD